jgi:hypothetical protein
MVNVAKQMRLIKPKHTSKDTRSPQEKQREHRQQLLEQAKKRHPQPTPAPDSEPTPSAIDANTDKLRRQLNAARKQNKLLSAKLAAEHEQNQVAQQKQRRELQALKRKNHALSEKTATLKQTSADLQADSDRMHTQLAEATSQKEQLDSKLAATLTKLQAREIKAQRATAYAEKGKRIQRGLMRRLNNLETTNRHLNYRVPTDPVLNPHERMRYQKWRAHLAYTSELESEVARLKAVVTMQERQLRELKASAAPKKQIEYRPQRTPLKILLDEVQKRVSRLDKPWEFGYLLRFIDYAQVGLNRYVNYQMQRLRQEQVRQLPRGSDFAGKLLFGVMRLAKAKPPVLPEVKNFAPAVTADGDYLYFESIEGQTFPATLMRTTLKLAPDDVVRGYIAIDEASGAKWFQINHRYTLTEEKDASQKRQTLLQELDGLDGPRARKSQSKRPLSRFLTSSRTVKSSATAAFLSTPAR